MQVAAVEQSAMDALFEAAEHAVYQTDTVALGESMEAIGEFIAELSEHHDDASRQALHQVRERLVRFQQLCAFAAQTLQDAFKAAAPKEEAGYGPKGAMKEKKGQAVLKRTYG